MTSADKRELQQMISAAIASAVQPLQDDIDRLKGTDKRHEDRFSTHSGAHRNLAADVQRAEKDLRQATNADIVRAVNELRGELTQKIEDRCRGAEAAAVASAHAAIAAKDATTDIAVTQVQTNSKVDKNTREGRVRTIAAIIGMIIAAVIHQLLKG